MAKRSFIKDRISKKKHSTEASVEGLPRITNETVAQHREEVLGSARKFIYPLTHSKHRVVAVSSLLIIALVMVFFGYMSLALYRFKSSSDFVYQTTKIVPFPIARVGGRFVAYENYLFELRRYMHYYENVEKTDFNDPVNAPQLAERKKRILQNIVDQAYIRELAQKNNVTVSEDEVDARLQVLKDQNRLGSSDKVFEDTLHDYYGWSVADFRRSIRNDILTSKVLAVVDVETRTKANKVVDALKQGSDFATIASTYSDEVQTKDAGGEIPGIVNPKDRNTPSERIAALAALKPGEVSEPITTSYGYEIIKKLEDKDGGYRAAHIIIAFKSIDTFINDLKAKDKSRTYISL